MSNQVLFLQNAWSPLFAGGTWPRASWQHALQRSRSGQRLRYLISDFEICENTTPLVGATPDSVIPPDEKYILSLLESRKPEIVIACGKQAEEVLSRLWKGALLAVPHPAHRLVTNELYTEGKRLLSGDFKSRLALRQGRGIINRVSIMGYSDYSVDQVCVQVNAKSDNVVDSKREGCYNQHHNPILI